MNRRRHAPRDVWAVIDADAGIDGEALALAGEARRLATATGGTSVTLVFGGEPSARALTRFVDRVIAAPPSGPDRRVETAVSLIAGRGAALVLLGETERETAGRLAARLDAGVATGCSSLEAGDGRLVLRRPVYGGLASATLRAGEGPVVACMLAGALRAPAPGEGEGVLEQAGCQAREERLRVLAQERLAVRDMPLGEAEVVVAGGLGLGGAENVRLLEELAGALGGTVAGSRPAVDRGWLPPERQVGQSGAFVAPRVYVACGISGAPQHVVGIRGAGMLIAVNSDPASPIMKRADVAIAGDLREVLPAMTAAVRSATGDAGGRLAQAAETLQ